MRVLLDTHALIWWLNDSERLGSSARDILAEPLNQVYVSAASAWEIAIKEHSSALRVSRPAEVFLPSELKRHRFEPLAIRLEHALAVASLPRLHKDPFDRILIAQAAFEDLLLMTSDDLVRQYDVSIVDASAKCR